MENESNDTKTTMDIKAPPADNSRHMHGSGMMWGVFGIFVIVILFLVAAGTMLMRHSNRELNVRYLSGHMAYPNMAHNRMGMHRGNIATGNRTLASITNINGNTITVRSQSNSLTVTVSSSTSFYKQVAIGKQSDLQTGDVVIIIGTPDSSGNIAATSIAIQ